MIYSNFRENGRGLKIQGDSVEVSTECTLIMREIYKKNREIFSHETALGILMSMLVKAIKEETSEEDQEKIEWRAGEEEKMGYTE